MGEIRARVIGQERGLYRLSYEGSEKLAEVSGKFRYEAVNISDYPAVGDYVVASWPEDESRSTISMVFPRKSCFKRKAAGDLNQEQIVAANIDTVFICMSLNKDYNLRRLERYLGAAWDSGAVPIVLLTKKDLCNDLEEKLSEVSSIAMGVEVLALSSLDESFSLLEEFLLPGKTYAFIGSSGVGKSTLINRLLGEDVLATGGLRNDDKGHHTTTHRELIMLQNGAFVVDTPGMRELGMMDHEEGLERTFSDIEELIEKCRFSNCSHHGEPGCAVKRAIEEGTLSMDRWLSYEKLMTENAYTSDQSSYLRAKEEKFKNISKTLKKIGKEKW